jgi:hypothetical protein
MSVPSARLLLVGALLLFSTEAHTSGREEKMTLAEVAAESSLVVVVTPADPPSRESSVDITPDGEKPSPKWPPYARHLTRWLVKEVLYDPERLTKAGTTIEVDRGNASSWLTIHRKRYLEGVNKIALIPTYEPHGAATKEPERIALLLKTELGFEYVAATSQETLAAKAEIVKLLAGREGDATPLPSAPPPKPPSH